MIDVNFDEGFLLKLAVIRGDLDLVRFLVGQGADIHLNDDLALTSAGHRMYVGIVKYLIEKGADPKKLEHTSGCGVLKYLTNEPESK